MNTIRYLLAAAVLLLAGAQASHSSETYTYKDLVWKLIDLESLAVLPEPGERGELASSYDRASRYDEATGKYIHWDANGDGQGVIREENGRLVLAEIEGPGVIWRIWSAAAHGGHVRIFLDDNPEPVVDLPFEGYFNRQNYPFVYPNLVYRVAQGLNSYVPIPFQKSCKIVADPGWGNYYHFNYTRFPEGTSVPTFTRDLPLADRIALAQVDNFLGNRLGEDPAGFREGQKIVRKTVRLRPGEKVTALDTSGPSAITAIRARLEGVPEDRLKNLLRGATIQMTWDNSPSPQVWSPLGDFFGTAPGRNYHKALPLGMVEDDLYCFFYMPFARRAEVLLGNDSRHTLNLEIQFTIAPLSQPIQKLGRFHAKWHRDVFLPQEPERWIDWPMLKTEGRGRYAGVMLEVWNPLGGWWGEGDEKFFVDGEKFPSTIGTGSEDYFGYAWCDPSLFQHGLHNQTISMGNKGHISVNRFHVADNIPFQKRFDGYIEKYFPNSRPTKYACIAYWYQEAGGKDPYQPVSYRDRTGWYVHVDPFRVKGALEGEALEVIGVSMGDVSDQELYHFGEEWSDGKHLWWRNSEPGHKLTLAVPVARDGTYRVEARFTKAHDYGIITVRLNGEVVKEGLDLYAPVVSLTDAIDLGRHRLSGNHAELELEITGRNPVATPGHMAGLDWIRLIPEK